MPEPTKCAKCPAMILWVQSSTTGNWMPLDADPVPEGNVIIKDGKGIVLKKDLFEQFLDGPRYVSHFATCPAATAFRKPKEKMP